MTLPKCCQKTARMIFRIIEKKQGKQLIYYNKDGKLIYDNIEYMKLKQKFLRGE